ncbi:MAG: bifunctional diaminohydroxyphosphoribosylaminopyrimidine deaminase/5-amino-6-(5-phosphoribosylamino)uracil reductase RibD [Thermoguttaceae bacterium]|nr:bifunctional diaminohydroxyphosphoribosylaminopyrimidine deaminase/5-amino-6-(5-phosphoribosylamino)uracil reductase RibD [Thermoguttaceae bacterium]
MASNLDQIYMKRALKLALRGQGFVEPNPMVGCVIVREDLTESDPENQKDILLENGEFDMVEGEGDSRSEARLIVGEGWHQKYGEAHAEINALKMAGEFAKGGVMYVTLEPCVHQGKTPPCVDRVIASGVKRVVIAMSDPFPQNDGAGIEKLRDAGIEVEVGVCEKEAQELNAPYVTRLLKDRPWLIGKWAMTLDGKIATRIGSSYWISSDEARLRVHEWRECVDAILIGSRTAMEDDPKLTVRLPEGRAPKRIPTRIVFDSGGTLSVFSELALTARDVPLLLVFGPNTPRGKKEFWESKGAEVLVLPAETHEERLILLFSELAARGMTNVLVEGGGELLGHLFDMEMIDEARVFVSPKIVGGSEAVVAVGGVGRELMRKAATLRNKKIEVVGPDVLMSGRVNY